MEFDLIKQLLVNPLVLQTFDPSRSAFLYAHSCEGSNDGLIPGGLGAVLCQLDPESGFEVVCAYASSTLNSAQSRYHIVHLEAPAFVWSVGKFNDWLEGVKFVLRANARANKFIHDSRFSSNPAICRYSLVVQAFTYSVEWISEIKKIADAFSRMVLVPSDEAELYSLLKIVFGPDIGSRIAAFKNNITPLDLNPSTKQQVSLSLASWSQSNIWLEDGSCELSPYFVLVSFPCSFPQLLAQEDDLDVDTSIPVNDIPPPADPPESLTPQSVPQLSDAGKLNGKSLAHVRAWFKSPGEVSPLPKTLQKRVPRLARKISIDGETLYKSTASSPKIVLDSVQTLNTVLKEIHDGQGHKGFHSSYHAFAKKY